MNAHLDSPGALASPGDNGNKFKDKCTFKFSVSREKARWNLKVHTYKHTQTHTHTHTNLRVHTRMIVHTHPYRHTHIDTQTSRHPLAQIIDDISTVTRPNTQIWDKPPLLEIVR